MDEVEITLKERAYAAVRDAKLRCGTICWVHSAMIFLDYLRKYNPSGTIPFTNEYTEWGHEMCQFCLEVEVGSGFKNFRTMFPVEDVCSYQDVTGELPFKNVTLAKQGDRFYVRLADEFYARYGGLKFRENSTKIRRT